LKQRKTDTENNFLLKVSSKKINTRQTQMDKLTANYEQFIKGKELSSGSKETFNRAIKKAVKSKPRSSK
jgi:hypothetical protein